MRVSAPVADLLTLSVRHSMTKPVPPAPYASYTTYDPPRVAHCAELASYTAKAWCRSKIIQELLVSGVGNSRSLLWQL